MTPEHLQVWRWRMDAATKPPFRVLLRVRLKRKPHLGSYIFDHLTVQCVLHRHGAWGCTSNELRSILGYPEARA
jgi:hypothetical protein